MIYFFNELLRFESRHGCCDNAEALRVRESRDTEGKRAEQLVVPERSAPVWPGDPIGDHPADRSRDGGRSGGSPPTIDELVAKAARQGPLRVIVELKLDPPGPPTREAIARAQDHVLQELAGTDHRVLRRFTTIPFMGIEMSENALRRLGGSARVAGVREDVAC